MIEEKVLQLAKAKGPLQPSDVARAIQKDSIMSGAVLADLVARKKMSITSVKKGSSPFYYLPDAPESIVALSEHLNSKDQATFSRLQSESILEEGKLSALERVSLRNMADYAIPLEVTFNGEKRIFWKYFLLSDTDAEDKIKKLLGVGAPKPVQEKAVVQEVKAPEATVETQRSPPEMQPEPKSVAVESESKPVAETPKLDSKPAEPKPEKKKAKKVKKPAPEQSTLVSLDDITDKLALAVKAYCSNNGMQLVNVRVIKAEKDIEGEIEVPQPFGSMTYLFKAKDKKKCNEGDVTAAFASGSLKRLPVLFMAPELTKKAVGLLDKELKNTVFHVPLEWE